MKYNYYSAEELALNPFFRHWVQYPGDPSCSAFWENWLLENPHKEPEVEQARQMVELLVEKKTELREEEKQVLWGRIQNTLADTEADEAAPLPVQPLPGWTAWRSAAAVAILLVAAALLWWRLQPKKIVEETSYGITRSVVLPDSSVVELNGNTRLSYFPDWSAQKPREVWLEGEAFFCVSHQHHKGNARFLVHSGDVTVEVLGTQFNVFQREENTRVVLSSGRVKLNVANQPDQLYMLPGEVVELSGHSGKMIRKVADPELYTSWKHQKLIFDETPLSEIASILKGTYGRYVVFRQASLARYRISGTVPSDNIDILLEALAKSSDLQIGQRGDTIYIDNNEFHP